MRYKTSCFNPPLSRNYLRRFWPLPLAVLAAVLLTVTLPLHGVLASDSSAYWLENVRYAVYSKSYALIPLTAVLSFAAAALMFRHIHTRKEIQFYHALPLRRSCLYITCWVTGFLMAALPVVLAFGLTAVMAAAMGGGALTALLQLLGMVLAALLIFYATAVLACVLAGQTFGALLIYAGMHCVVWVLLYCGDMIAALFMPGLDILSILNTPAKWLTPLYNLLAASAVQYTDVLLENGTWDSILQGYASMLVPLVYALVGVLAAVLAGLLYQRRPAEAAGETLAFSGLRSVCKVLGALMVTAAGGGLILTSGLFSGEISFAAVLAAVLFSGAVGYLAAEMIIRRSLRVFQKEVLCRGGILLAILLVLMAVGKADVFGRVNYVPDAEKVSSVSVRAMGGYSVDMEPEDAVALHAEVLSHTDDLTNNPYAVSYNDLTIIYTLTNGKTLTRSYMLRYDYDDEGWVRSELTQLLEDALSEPDYVYQSWFGPMQDVTTDLVESAVLESNGVYNDETDEYTTYLTSSDSSRWSDENGFLTLSEEEAVALYSAVCRDIQAGRLAPSGFEADDPIGYLSLSCRETAYDTSYGSYQQYLYRVNTNYTSVFLYRDMTETIACLESMGITCRDLS